MTDRPHGAARFDDLPDLPVLRLPADVRDWALAGADGSGVTVAIVDSGVQDAHPLVGRVDEAIAVVVQDGEARLVEGPHDDLVGHGTACAGIVRSLAPACRLVSLRVLGENLTGTSRAVAAALEWAIQARVDVVNLSLSTANAAWYARLHELVDEAFYAGTVVVGAVNNVPRPSYPSDFAAAVSVASTPTTDDPFALVCRPGAPAEFGAAGIDVEVPWVGGGTAVVTGNSFAAPRVAGLAALLRSKHPWLTPAQVRVVLAGLALNAEGADAATG